MTTTTTYPQHKTLDRFTVWSHLDNHEPGREYFRGEITVLDSLVEPGDKIYVLEANEAFMKRIETGPNPIFLLDDGETVQPLYISGWPASFDKVWLQPFPTNPGGEKTRPDGRVIDYRLWALGPRLAYHLKRD